MRTSIEIDDELLAEARRPSGAGGKRETLDTALREPVARHRGPRILGLRGKVHREGEPSATRRDRRLS